VARVSHNARRTGICTELAERWWISIRSFSYVAVHHLKTLSGLLVQAGTGGTGGVSYLAKALELKFFSRSFGRFGTSM